MTLNPMVRERIERALTEAGEATEELNESVFHERFPPKVRGTKIITVHPEAWYSVDAGLRGAYRARAIQLGVKLEVGDTGVPNRHVVLVLDDKAEWFPSDGGVRDHNSWERKLEELLGLD